MIDSIKWLGHGSFLIEGPPFIFINPWRVARTPFHADLILVTHSHYDHCSVADVEKLRGPETVVIGNEQVAEQINGTKVLRPWQSIAFERLSIKAIPAYSPEGGTHPESAGGLGFVISMNLYDIYYAGDTKQIPAMEKVHPDIAILPIDNNDTLSMKEAVKVIELLKPKWVIPSNWGTLSKAPDLLEVNEFKAMVGKLAEVVIPVASV